MGILWDNSLLAFLVVTCALGCGAAYMTGRAMAMGWKTLGILAFYCFLLAIVARFLHFALYDGALLSAYYFIVNFIIIMAVGLLGFRVHRVKQMTHQWRARSGA
jgi:hypothetical protein